MPDPSLVPTERIERAILMLRGHKVMLDSDLAALYGVKTKVLNRAVSRNIERFPEDFMFQPTEEEATRLRSQIVTLKTGRGQHLEYLSISEGRHACRQGTRHDSANRPDHSHRPRAAGDPGQRPGRDLWRHDQGLESGGQTQYRTVPAGFSVSADSTGSCRLEVTICDLKWRENGYGIRPQRVSKGTGHRL